MQFGHFDDANKEYVINRPDTPRSWSNYLGSTEYGAIITNNAGGYSFYKSAARGVSCGCASTRSPWTSRAVISICMTTMDKDVHVRRHPPGRQRPLRHYPAPSPAARRWQWIPGPPPTL